MRSASIFNPAGLLGLALLFTSCSLINPKGDEAGKLVQIVETWLDDYSQGRLKKVEGLFSPKAVVAVDWVDGKKQRVYTVKEFMGKFKAFLAKGNEFQERLDRDPIVLIDYNTATIWAPYTVKSKEKSSKGIDIFQMLKINGSWKIVSLAYSSRSVAR